MNLMFKKYIYIILLLNICFLSERIDLNNNSNLYRQANNSGSGNDTPFVGEFDLPEDPSFDRAKGYAVQGRAKSAYLNFGNFIDGDHFPAGGWGPWSYLPNVTFMAGVPGYINTAEFEWEFCSGCLIDLPAGATAWLSSEAYDSWYNEQNDGRYAGIAYKIEDDRGELALPRSSYDDLGTDRYICDIFPDEDLDEDDCESRFITTDDGERYGQWIYNSLEFNLDGLPLYGENSDYEFYLSEDDEVVYLIMLDDYQDPNNASSFIGLVYPWAFRPKFKNRNTALLYDEYDYGPDEVAWSADDYYDFYGAQVAEGWLTRVSNKTNTDWQASVGAAQRSHNLDYQVQDLFGDADFGDTGNDTYAVLAHSDMPLTWPSIFNEQTLEYDKSWPGWYADEYFGDDPGSWESNGIDPLACGSDPSRKNPDCWKESNGTFTSASDIYIEFDDRWAHRGNMIEDGAYAQTGYPMGITVRAMAHSYDVSYAEDIMFVTVKVRNESGDYDYAFKRNSLGEKEKLVDYKGNYISGDALIMPDGTKLNDGKGFNYERAALGFYMDADALWGDLNGYGAGVHTNDDDFMEYYDCIVTDEDDPDWDFASGCPIIDGDTLRISMAMIYDYDGTSNIAQGFGNIASYNGDMGIVATQLLDSPYATEPVDLTGDGDPDIYPGQGNQSKLKMTDWHWFDWYNRPGVVANESGGGCYAGGANCPQARNKEEIMYKLLSGDNTNLSNFEKEAYFHTSDPTTDLDQEPNPPYFNPHFDSLEGLTQTSFFTEGNLGLDCVLLLSCAPFDLEVGEEVNFSFCIIFGQDRQDLLKNAEFAQIMYNAHYQGYTAPKKPKVALTTTSGQVKVHWTNAPEPSKDVITNYTDFAGYKIYKSTNGGEPWGPGFNKIYDNNNNFYGWQPFKQFDMSAIQDSSFCILGFEPQCYIDGIVDSGKISEESCVQDNGLWLDFDDRNLDGVWTGSYYDEFGTWIDAEPYYCVDDELRGVEVSGIDPNASWVNLGTNNGLELVIPDPQCTIPDISEDECLCGVGGNWINSSNRCENTGNATGYNWDKFSSENCLAVNEDEESCEDVGVWKRAFYRLDGEDYKYTYIDNDVIDGFEYTYSVTSFDTGVMADIITVTPTEDSDNDGINDSGWESDTTSVPDPNGWAAVNPFQSLESGKGTSVYDDNFAKIIPGTEAQFNWDEVSVTPNPFIISSAYQTNPFEKKLMFSGLSQQCTIKIYTVTGELVNTIYHTNDNASNEGIVFWDLRNEFDTEVAPGLYFFAIEDAGSNDEVYLGKFVIIR